MRVLCHLFAVACLTLVMADLLQAQGNRRGGGGRAEAFQFLAEKYDTNGDGKIDSKEYTRDKQTFKRLDQNKDGQLTVEDWQSRGGFRGRRGNARRIDKAPTKGQAAPDFELTQIQDAEKKLLLSSFAGKKPVALVFGSCT